ncbi:aldose 1-epimerase [Dokdonia sinensis]|uniref:Aldose 1-epimerase n=1 Tax=Dokdonia sinensis TaxID=2479847 RepID=A0A3M0G5P6_9FLAO|nr:aldose 1-epimerase [Dokdonia sinensis]RMB57113.1 aldose 1-epimerase [Dokdonia sinensis]
MFAIKKRFLGTFTEVFLEDINTGVCVSCIPDHGAQLNHLNLLKNGKSHALLWSAHTAHEFTEQSIPYFSGSHLFPFPNRIDGGRYSFNGDKLKLNCNETSNYNALHGLIFNKPFELQKTETDSAFAKAEFSYSTNTRHPGFPFLYTIAITYTIFKNKLLVETRVRNNDDKKFLFGLGSHPYINTGTSINKLLVQHPGTSSLELNNRMIPTGNTTPDLRFLKAYTLGTTTLDHCFVLSPNHKMAVTRIIDPIKNLNIEIRQENSEGRYNFLQLYTSPDRNSIAVEPMTCAPDAFNNDKGILFLEPEDTYTSYFEIALT